MDEDIKKALEVLKNGGTILYPTDTIWGIGCDATNSEAVKKVTRIKEREDTKSMLILVDVRERITQYIDRVPDIAWELIEIADSPLTIIYPGAKNLAPNLIAKDGSVGIRIVNDVFCKKLISRLRKPIVSTSANIAGKNSPKTFHAIDENILHEVDYIVKWRQEDTNLAHPSSIIRLSMKNEIQIIRK